MTAIFLLIFWASISIYLGKWLTFWNSCNPLRVYGLRWEPVHMTLKSLLFGWTCNHQWYLWKPLKILTWNVIIGFLTCSAWQVGKNVVKNPRIEAILDYRITPHPPLPRDWNFPWRTWKFGMGLIQNPPAPPKIWRTLCSGLVSGDYRCYLPRTPSR